MGFLAGKRFLILGAGPVGTAAAVLAAGRGASVQLASHASLDRASKLTDMVAATFGAAVEPVYSDDACWTTASRSPQPRGGRWASARWPSARSSTRRSADCSNGCSPARR